jgi:group I intron endonuclease
VTDAGHIYLISGVQGQGIYIGQTVLLTQRWKRHQRELEDGCHHNPYLQRAVSKHGSDSYAYVVAEEVPVEELTEREQAWMDQLRAEGVTVYNIAPAVGPCRLPGYKHTQETKAKMSVARRGKKLRLTAEQREKMSEIRRGKPLSSEHREKVIRGLIGRPVSDETKRRIAESVRKSWSKRR